MSLDINTKMQEIKKAVESCGVKVTGVHFDTSLADVKVIGNSLPVITHLSLEVTFDLELQPVNQKRLTTLG